MRVQRIVRDNCPSTQNGSDRRLRAAWLSVPDPLRARPDPRRPWDAAARSECPYDPWSRTIEPLRSALSAAIRTGDQNQVKAVALRIENFFDVMKAEVIADLPLRDEANILRIAIEETERQGEAGM